MQIKSGSMWASNNSKKFVVISVTEVDGHSWVHYRDDGRTDAPREYSCYEESFMQRFTPILNESR
jgi:hypothetical protein